MLAGRAVEEHSRTLAQPSDETSADTLPHVVSGRVIELIAGIAAVGFVTCMLWSDFAAEPTQRWA
jgi:hypothetical protein